MGIASFSSSVSWGGYFFFYELAKQRMRHGSNQQLGPMQHLLAGLGGGAVMVVLTNPMWLVKTRLQLQRKTPGNTHLYKNTFGE